MLLKDYIKVEVFKGKNLSILQKYKLTFLEASSNAVFWIRVMQYFYQKYKVNNSKLFLFLAKKTQMKLIKKYSIHIAFEAKLGLGLHLPHPASIIIGNAVVLGRNCSIYQGVTIGGRNIGDVKRRNQPHIGDGCVFFSHAQILGAITVNNNITVGSLSLLINNALEPGVYLGIPAKKHEYNK